MTNWKEIKLFLLWVPAVIFWLVSSVCFVYGLSFETPIVLIGTDFSMMIAIGLSISNTIIQLAGNDATKDDLGTVLFFGWIASYILGIGSNVNTLLKILNISAPLLDWTVAVSLGAIIEIMPERLVIRYFKQSAELNREKKISKNRESQTGVPTDGYKKPEQTRTGVFANKKVSNQPKPFTNKTTSSSPSGITIPQGRRATQTSFMGTIPPPKTEETPAERFNRLRREVEDSNSNDSRKTSQEYPDEDDGYYGFEPINYR